MKPSSSRWPLAGMGARFDFATRRNGLVLLCTCAALTTHLAAQTFSTLHSFSALNDNTNRDGAGPVAGLTISGTTLFGTAPAGGAEGDGVVFAMGKDGTGFRILHDFAVVDAADGTEPAAALTESAGVLYGTTAWGGLSGNGTVFALRTDGADYSILHHFVEYYNRPDEPLEGGRPSARLTLGSNVLYGATAVGGNTGSGSLFSLGTNGAGFRTLFGFTAGADGEFPNELSLTNQVLYGSALAGTLGGSIFAIDTIGGNFTILYNFTNIDGDQPAGLVVFGTNLYGTTRWGGGDGAGWGTVFSARTDGAQYHVLHRFSAASFATTDINQATNADGAFPRANLILSGATLYGTTSTGGMFGNGTVFAINTDGSGFTNLHTFSALTRNTNSDGAHPYAALLLQGDTLYGTTSQGGTSGSGTVFAIQLPGLRPRLDITVSGGSVVLTWPAEATGFSLYSSSELGAAVWTPVSPAPAVINSRNTVTNSISGEAQFYRLQP